MRALALAIVLAASVKAPVQAQSADPVGELGGLEREAVETALARRGLRVDPSPEGKTVRAIHVVNLEVFSEQDFRPLRWLNVFHVTTRERVIEREVLLRPGMSWDDRLAEETQRNLQDPFLSNVVVVLPVASPVPGTVDVLVVTRDVWSLRLNSNFEVQEDDLVQLSFSLSENNLFGLRKKIAMVFFMDQGAIAIGPTYIDDNLAGTRLTLSTSFRALFAREDGEFEGTASRTIFAYPLWSLARTWGGSIDVYHSDSVIRSFQGSELRVVDLEGTPEVEALPFRYRLRRVSATASGVRSFGQKVIQRVSAGYEFDLTRPELFDFPYAEPAAELFAEQVFPRSERSSALFVSYRLFTPDFRAYRDLDTFDLREDVRLGPHLELRVSGASELFGSENDFVGLAAAAGWAVAFARTGYARLSVGWSGRLEDRLIDRQLGTSVGVATPHLFRFLRLVAGARLSVQTDDTQNRFYTIGGNEGLRGYAIGAFIGGYRTSSAAETLAHLEARTRPLPLWSLRAGAVAFWDAGHAADTVEDLRLHHDVGVGLRLLIPQLDPYVMRVDWALPLTGPTAGFPGRFSLGFKQVF